MFSAEQRMAMTLTAGLRRAMACIAPTMAAAPAMSYFIFSMPSAGLMEMPPVSKVMPLPTRPRTGAPPASRCGRRLVGHDDERGRFGGAFGDGPEGLHLQLLDFVRGVDLALQAGLVAHGLGARAEHGGGEDVAGFVDERAGEVLRSGNDKAFVEAGANLLLGGGVGMAGDKGERVDGEILAVAAVGVVVLVAELGALHDGARGERGGQGRVEAGGGLREGDGYLANGAWLGGADGCSCTFTQFVEG
jgi:hypothetical protein